MNKKLFMMQRRVRLTRDHAKYAECEWGFLSIFLYAEDEQKAAENATLWATLLPYKLGPGRILPIDENSRLTLAEIKCAEAAELVGGAMMFISYRRGTDEKQALAHWPYLVPPMNLPTGGQE